MRIVTKHSGPCVAVATHPEHKFVYSGGADGMIHVLSNEGEVVFTKPRQKGGAAGLAMAMNGGRLVYLQDQLRTLAWRDVRTDPAAFPVGGSRKLPRDLQGAHLSTTAADSLFAVGCDQGLLWVGQWGRGRGRTHRIVQEVRHQMPAGSMITCVQYVSTYGTLLAVGVHQLNTGASWNGHLSLYEGVPDRCSPTRLTPLFDVDVGHGPRCVARTTNKIVYAGLHNGHLMRLDLRGYVPGGPRPDPAVISIPQSPRVSAVAASSCGRFVAVGADYGDYGGVLLYDAELKPLAMFDTSSEPHALAFHEPWLPDDPPAPSLFSGHEGGQVVKWYIDRQLTWMRLVAETRKPKPLVGAFEEEETAHQRAIDL